MNRNRSGTNMSDEPATWPDDDEDPFATPTPSDDGLNGTSNDEPLDTAPEVEEPDALPEQESPAIIEPVLSSSTDWTLPVRVAPVLALSGEEVAEYPLHESVDGKRNTSLVFSENLIRVMEVTYDDDGQRRLNVKAVFNNELTGFSHNHNELMHKHQWMWIASFFGGLVATFIPVVGFLGQILLAVGIIGWSYMHLEVHTLEFSTSGSKHKIAFTGYGSNRARFRASMALIGPTIAKYMDTGDFDTESINSLHKSLSAPTPAPQPPQLPAVVIEEPPLPLPPPPEAIPQPLAPNADESSPPAPETPLPLPAETTPPPQPEISGPPVSSPLPDPPTIVPEGQDSPTPALPPPPAPLTPPLPPPLPPATLPPPLPPGQMMAPPPPGGFDLGEVPLDAPLPDAPEISVAAAPIEESLSDDEKNELLEELK